MARACRLRAIVQPGHRVSVTAPDLAVGHEVEVILVDETALASDRQDRSMLAFLDSLPRRQYSSERWADIEAEFQRERDSWAG